MESQDIIEELQGELQLAKTKNHQLNTALASSGFNAGDPNAIESQLNTTELLDRIEHFLKGDYIEIDEEGNETWVTQEDEEHQPLNNFGVKYTMAVLTMYLDKNTSLSNYNEMRINEILADVGDALARRFYWSYERMGMNTEYKKSQYETIVLTIIHIIESAYRKAIGGSFREDLNTSRIYTESNRLGIPDRAMQPQKKKFNLFRPSTWI